MTGPRPPFAQPGLLALVAAGGAVGTTARWAVARLMDAPDGTWPWPTFAVNVVGSFLLGALLAGLGQADEGRRRQVRLGAGTGLLGGFTTYSTFALEVDVLARDGYLVLAAAYAVTSVVVGVAAAAAGAVVAQLGRARGAGEVR